MGFRFSLRGRSPANDGRRVDGVCSAAAVALVPGARRRAVELVPTKEPARVTGQPGSSDVVGSADSQGKVTRMALFAARFLTLPQQEPPMPPGRYDEDRALWVDEFGAPMVDTLRGMPTRADRDRPDVLATVTKAERDRDSPIVYLSTTKTSAGRDKDRASVASP